MVQTPPDLSLLARTNCLDGMATSSATSKQRYPVMLNETDLQEFYEEQLKEYQERYKNSKSALIERQIELIQELIRNQKKLMGIRQ
jgi:hypothetical protein